MGTQTCPRRMNEMGPWKREENLDDWTTGRGLAGVQGDNLSCSFCGSLHPADFLRLVGEGWIVGATDKSYKAYLARPYSADEVASRRAHWEATDRTVRAVREIGERDGKTAEQIAADIEKVAEVALAPSGGATIAKFYFQHLDGEQRAEFIELYNSGRMRIDSGGFYVMPYFCKTTPAAA